jgi:hypothetical protein
MRLLRSGDMDKPDLVNHSGKLGNYVYHFKAEELSRPLPSGHYLSELYDLRRLEERGATTIDPLPIVGEGHGETRLEAHKDLEEQMHEWIKEQPDFNPDFRK